MSPGQNGYEDEPEDEREELAAWESQADGWRGESEDAGKRDAFEGWPEDQAGPEYWLRKREDEDSEC